MRSSIIVAALTASLWLQPLTAAAQQDCPSIMLESGQQIIEGMAPADDVVCYELYALQGMRAELEIASGRNVIFSVRNLVDAQDRYVLEFGQDGWTILVGQLMRAIEDEPFVLRITVAQGS